MPEDDVSAAGRRFARDLRRIRSRQNVSIDDVRDETKIPKGLIDSFEETALLDHDIFNHVYLRSFVRTYARTIHISPDDVSRAFEKVVEGTYKDALAREYLPDEAREEGEEERAGEAADRERAEEAADREREGDAGAAGAAGMGAAAGEQDEAAARDRERGAEAQEADETEMDQAPAARQRDERGAAAGREGPSEASGERPPAWTEKSGSSSGRRSSRSRRERSSDNSAKWIAGLAAVAVLVVIIWVFVAPGGGNGGETAAVQADNAEAAAEQTAAAEQDGTPADAEPITLNETMIFRVTASSEDGVQDLKVTRDNETRRPYWIEPGASDTFHAESRIVFEQQLDEISLQVQGYPIPTDQRDTQGRLVITRERAQSYLDSLSMAAAQ